MAAVAAVSSAAEVARREKRIHCLGPSTLTMVAPGTEIGPERFLEIDDERALCLEPARHRLKVTVVDHAAEVEYQDPFARPFDIGHVVRRAAPSMSSPRPRWPRTRGEHRRRYQTRRA